MLPCFPLSPPSVVWQREDLRTPAVFPCDVQPSGGVGLLDQKNLVQVGFSQGHSTKQQAVSRRLLVRPGGGWEGWRSACFCEAYRTWVRCGPSEGVLLSWRTPRFSSFCTPIPRVTRRTTQKALVFRGPAPTIPPD